MLPRVFFSGFAVLALVGSQFANAQNQEKTSDVIGTREADAASQQLVIAPNRTCATYNFTTASPGFNYTAKLGLAELPTGCDEKLIRVLKQYTFRTCLDTRANNYPVKDLKITQECANKDKVARADLATCKNAFAKAPGSAYAPKGIGASNTIDEGTVCWNTPRVFYFIENGCTSPVTATIKEFGNCPPPKREPLLQLTWDRYTGDCKDESDSDDGGDDAGGSGSTSSSGGGGLSSGAKAGIAIGVIAAVIIIAAAVWFCCCQLKS